MGLLGIVCMVVVGWLLIAIIGALVLGRCLAYGQQDDDTPP